MAFGKFRSRWRCLFFFQAEDGIRDGRVTGVQTCALPICPRDADAARAPESRGLSRLRFELLVEHGAVAREAGEVVAGAELADEARRMPRGAAGEVATLEEHDVAPPELRQVIRDAASDDPASDDDGARVRRNRAGHRRTIAHRK